MVQADTILNVVWALVCLSAAGAFLRAERHRHSSKRTARALAVFLCGVSLFPCVSASDDSIYFRFLDSSGQSRNSGSGPEKTQATLVRMLEALESVQVPVIWSLAVVLCFFSLLVTRALKSLVRVAPQSAGRDPPYAAVHSLAFSF